MSPTLNPTPVWLFLVLMLEELILAEYPESLSIQCLLLFQPNFPVLSNIHSNVSMSLARGCFHISCMLIFTDSISPATLILFIFVLQIWCHVLSRNVPRWLPLILLANDIEMNPGPPLQNQFLSFMNWNLNSLVRVGLIEAHNTNFYYDLITVCETNLNDSIGIPETLL